MPNLGKKLPNLGMSQEQHKSECLQRWQQLEQEARRKWADFKRKRITRQQLESWLREQSAEDEKTIRGIFNSMRGG